jgi:hypothetical protein
MTCANDEQVQQATYEAIRRIQLMPKEDLKKAFGSTCETAADVLCLYRNFDEVEEHLNKYLNPVFNYECGDVVTIQAYDKHANLVIKRALVLMTSDKHGGRYLLLYAVKSGEDAKLETSWFSENVMNKKLDHVYILTPEAITEVFADLLE